MNVPRFPLSLRRFWMIQLVCVAIVILLAIAFRLPALDAPFMDYHSWRQTDTATVARNFTRYGYNLFRPLLSTTGAVPTPVEMEFPLLNGLTALIWGIFGEHAWGGRLLSVLFATGGTICFYFLVYRISSGTRQRRTFTALLAGLIYTLSPYNIFFGRAFMPDAEVLALSIATLLAGVTWLDKVSNGTARWGRWFWLAAGLAALTGLVKIPGLLVLMPLGIFWLARPQTRRLVPQMIVFSLFALVPSLVWYTYIASITDPAAAFGLVSQGGGDRIGNFELWFDPNFYTLLWSWLNENILTEIGVGLACLGLIIPVIQLCFGFRQTLAQYSRPQDGTLGFVVRHLFGLVWGLAVFAFTMVVDNGLVNQDYYFLPAVAPGALLAGQALSWLASGLLFRRERLLKTAGGLLVIVCLSGIAVETYNRLPPLYEQNTVYYTIAQEMRRVTPPGSSLLIVQYSHPEILYYADRTGIPILPEYFNLETAESARRKGIRYLLITAKSDLDSKPDIQEIVRRYAIAGYSENWVLFDLQQTPAPPIQIATPFETFGNEIALDSVSIITPSLPSDQPLQIHVQWRALQKPQGNYSLSLRLLNARDEVIAQDDMRPLGGLWRTDLWQVGQPLSDLLLMQIPTGTTPGTYHLEVRMYDGDRDLARQGSAVLPQAVHILPAVNVPPPPMEHTLDASFGSLTLLGYALPDQPYREGETIPLTLLWRREAGDLPAQTLHFRLALASDLTHANPITVSLDTDYPAGRWQQGELVRVIYRLPVPAPMVQGQYRLLLQAGTSVAGVTLGSVEVQTRQRSYTLPDFPYHSGEEFSSAGGIRPAAFQVSSLSLHPGGVLTLTVAWQAGSTAPADKNLRVFTHLLDPTGKVAAQDDRWSCDEACPTTSWLPGEVVTEVYTMQIKQDAPPGKYTIEVGLYDPETNDRARTATNQDHILLPVTIDVVSGQ